MPSFKIRGVYEYEGVVEAANEEQAYKFFLQDLNMHYVGTDELEQTMVCPSCEEEIASEDELTEEWELCEECTPDH